MEGANQAVAVEGVTVEVNRKAERAAKNPRISCITLPAGGVAVCTCGEGGLRYTHTLEWAQLPGFTTQMARPSPVPAGSMSAQPWPVAPEGKVQVASGSHSQPLQVSSRNTRVCRDRMTAR